MSEVTIEPTPLVWMGRYEDLPDGPWEIGWAFFHDFSGNDLNPSFDFSIREPITVICPCLHHWEDGSRSDELAGTVFTIDKLSTIKRKPWEVSVDLDSLIVGRKPMITVNPSIYLVGIWHGWLQEGILRQRRR